MVRPLVFALFRLLCLDSYEGMDRRVEHHVSAGLACLPLLVYAHSDVSGRSVSDMPFGQDGVT